MQTLELTASELEQLALEAVGTRTAGIALTNGKIALLALPSNAWAIKALTRIRTSPVKVVGRMLYIPEDQPASEPLQP